MTSIQQFIETALAGGWRPENREFSSIGFYERYFEYQLRSSDAGRSPAIRCMAYETILLDPKVWQAVGKVEKWYEGHYGPEWLHHMHKMVDALAEGQTLESYIRFVLAKTHTREVSNPRKKVL